MAFTKEQLDKYKKHLDKKKKPVQKFYEGGTSKEGDNSSSEASNIKKELTPDELLPFLGKLGQERALEKEPENITKSDEIENKEVPAPQETAVAPEENATGLSESAQALHNQLGSEPEEGSQNNLTEEQEADRLNAERQTGEPSTDKAMGVDTASMPEGKEEAPETAAPESQAEPEEAGEPVTEQEKHLNKDDDQTVPEVTDKIDVQKAINDSDKAPLSYQEQLRQQYAQQNNDLRGIQIQKAMHIIASGILKQKPNPEVYNEELALAGQRVKQFEDIYQAGKEDPNSPDSKAARDAVGNALNIDLPDNLSASALEKLLPGLSLPAKWTAAKSLAQMKVDSAAEKSQADIAAKGEQARETAGFKGQTSANVDKKMQLSQQKQSTDAEQKMRSDLDKFRGNKAVQNANEAVRNVDTALPLINSKTDPNQLSTQEYKLLLEEVSKIASGGVATASTIKDISGNTLQNKASQFISTVGGNPTPAQLGGFVSDIRKYLGQVYNTNRNIVDTFRLNSITGYKNKVSPEAYNQALKDYHLEGKSLPEMTKPTVGTNQQAGEQVGAPPKTGPGEQLMFSPKTKSYWIKDAQGNLRKAE